MATTRRAAGVGPVLISNAFSDDNKGGAALSAATIRMVQRALPDSQIQLLAVNEETGSAEAAYRFTLSRFPEVTIRDPLIKPPAGPLAGLRTGLRSLWTLAAAPFLTSEAIRDVAVARLVISRGGHIFVGRGKPRRAMSLWLTGYPLVLASRLGVPTVVLCTSVGPFATWYDRLVNRAILRRVDLLVVRDEYSYREALALGVDPSRVLQLRDIVFSYPSPSPEQRRLVAARCGLEGQRFGVVTVAQETPDRRFFANLSATLRQLLDRNLIDRVVVVSHAKEDGELSREFARYTGHPAVQFLEEDLSPDDLMALYGAARFLVGRRLHSTIFSLIAGTPTFAVLRNSMKVQGVMKSLGLTDLVLPYPEIDPAELASRLESVILDPEPLSSRIRSAVEQARRELAQVPRLLSTLPAHPTVGAEEPTEPALTA